MNEQTGSFLANRLPRFSSGLTRRHSNLHGGRWGGSQPRPNRKALREMIEIKIFLRHKAAGRACAHSKPQHSVHASRIPTRGLPQSGHKN